MFFFFDSLVDFHKITDNTGLPCSSAFMVYIKRAYISIGIRSLMTFLD